VRVASPVVRPGHPEQQRGRQGVGDNERKHPQARTLRCEWSCSVRQALAEREEMSLCSRTKRPKDKRRRVHQTA